jgi:hypothetical protein
VIVAGLMKCTKIQVSALSVANTLIGITMKMKNSMEDIIEYTRTLRDGTTQAMYRSKWMNQEYHSDDKQDIIEWLLEKITNVEKYKAIRKAEDKAITSFFEGALTSKD